MKKTALLLTFATIAAASQATVLNFEGFAAGTWMREQYAPMGVHISANNSTSSHPDKAIIFDSANPTGDDSDLATPGYHATNTVPYGKILILAENDRDQNSDGLVDDPDDEGNQPAGWIKFRLDFVAPSGHVDLIDIEETGGTLKFYLNSNLVQTLSIPNMGDNSVQRIAFSGFHFDEMKVNLQGSGAVGELELVPEPATLGMLAVGFLALARRRKRA
jgi:hypothetical protein